VHKGFGLHQGKMHTDAGAAMTPTSLQLMALSTVSVLQMVLSRST